MISDTDEVGKRRALLKGILDRVPGKPVFENLLNFYKGIFLQKPDLIVCMSRKSWCVIHLFLPLLENEGIVVDRKKLTHDRMVHPWFAEQDHNKHSKIKVFVIDDTFQTGRAIDDCVLRLKWVYNVDEKNLTVAVFAMTDNKYNRRRIDENSYTAYDSHSRGKLPLKVNWNGGEVFYTKENVSAFSYLFVEAIHACSEPYVGYIPAFRLPIEVVRDFLGTDRGKDIESDGKPGVRISGYLEQDDLREPFNDPDKIGYYNITSQQMRQSDIEAFYFSLPCLDFDNTDNSMSFLPTSDALSVAALRFYLNRKTGIALIVPYLSLKDCRADADIIKMFPKKLRPLMNYMDTTGKWNDKEEHIAAYRLLRYASGYLWGKYVLQHWFKCEVKEENIASRGGICSETFFDWLNSSSAVQDLTDIWPFFAPKMNYVVEKTRSLLELDSKTSFEKIIHDDMLEDEADFGNVINKSLSVSAPVDYFNTASMMFRNIFNREHKMLDEHKGKEEFPLPPPFRGFPIHTFFDLLLLKFPKLKTRRDVLTTVMLMLCDMGEAVTQLCQRGNVIGTVLCNGEQSCHALVPIAPEYAHFLSEFPELIGKFNKEQRQEKFEMAKTEIQKYFEDEINQGNGRHLSLEELMSPLEDIRTIVVDDPNQDFIAYSVLPRSSFFDCSELFFADLREKLRKEVI